MKLSHLLFPRKKVIDDLRLQLAEANHSITNLQLDLSQENENTQATIHTLRIQLSEANSNELHSAQEKIKESEIQIRNFKAAALELQQEQTSQKEIITSLKLKIKELQNDCNFREKEKNEMAKIFQEKIVNDANAINAIDENPTLKELKKRNGVQSDTILKLQLQLSELKNKSS